MIRPKGFYLSEDETRNYEREVETGGDVQDESNIYWTIGERRGKARRGMKQGVRHARGNGIGRDVTRERTELGGRVGCDDLKMTR